MRASWGARVVCWAVIISMLPGPWMQSIWAQQADSARTADGLADHAEHDHLEHENRTEASAAVSLRPSEARRPLPNLPAPFPDADVDLDAVATELAPTREEIEAAKDAILLAQAAADPNASGLIQRARQHEEAGRHLDAAKDYLDVLEKFPRTASCSLAYKNLERISRNAISGVYSAADVEAFEQSLPTWEEATSAESKYILIGMAYTRSEAARVTQRSAEQDAYNQWLIDASWKFMEEFPDHPIQVLAIRHLTEAASWLGPDVYDATIEQLEDFCRTEQMSYATIFANFVLGINYMYRVPNSHQHYRMFSSLRQELNTLDYETDIADLGCFETVRGWIVYARAMADYALGDLDEAIAGFERIESEFGDMANAIPMESGFQRAMSIDYKHETTPYDAILEYQAFIDDYPDTAFEAKALQRMARRYMLAGDYNNAALVFEEILRKFPTSYEAMQADQGLEYISHHVNMDRRYIRQALKVNDLLCGPLALNQLLAREGIAATLPEMVRLSDVTENGSSMASLRDAASRKGLDLVGVETATLDELRAPFIALLDHAHYVLVTDVNTDTVLVVDESEDAYARDRRDFEADWTGIALVKQGSFEVAELLGDSTLLDIFGGNCQHSCCGLGWPQSGGNGTKPKPPKCNCTTCKVPPSAAPGTTASFGSSGAGGPAGADPDAGNGGDSAGADAGSAQGSRGSFVHAQSVSSGIRSPGVNMTIDIFESTQEVEGLDFSIPVKGTQSLKFRRTFANPEGIRRGYYAPNHPLQRNIGLSWNHNYNMHLRAGTLWAEILLVQEDGSSLSFVSTGDDGTWENYSHDNYGGTLRRHLTTGVYEYATTNGLTYHFSSDVYATVFVGYARLESIADQGGNEITFTYDDPDPSKGYLTRVDAPTGDDRYLEFTYNLDTQISRIDLKNSTTTLKYVEYGYTGNQLTQVIEDGQAVSIDYTYLIVVLDTLSGFYMDSITDRAGEVYDFDYNYTGDDADTITLTYPDLTEAVFARDTTSGVATYEVLDSQTQAVVRKTNYIPHAVHDTMAAIERVKNAQLNVARWDWTYDTNGELLSQIGPDGSVDIEYTYTAESQLLTKRLGDQVGDPTWSYSYPAGSVYPTSVTDPEGQVTTITYDANGQRASRVRPMHDGTLGYQYGRDANGQVTTWTDPAGKVTTFGYDAFGNRTTVTDPLNNVTTTTYDDLGRVKTVTDDLGRVTTYTYAGTSCSCSNFGNLIEIKDDDNNITSFEYDDNDNRTKVIDPLGIETVFTYDEMNRVTSVTHDGVLVSTTVYDALGQVETQTDANGNVTTIAYDYFGRQVTVTDAVGTTTTAYDDEGQVTSVTDGNNHTWSYEYDDYDRLELVTDPIGKKTHYTYDLNGRMIKVGAGATGTFDPTEYIYDATTGLLDEVKYTSGVDVKSAFYEYDAVGRLTRIRDWIDNVDGIQYAYDDAGRLTDITDYDGSVLTYAYDDVGNVTSMNDYHGNVTSYTYTDLNQLDTLTAPGSKVWDWTYDAAGRPTQYTHPNGMTTEYDYDTRGRLVEIAHKDGATVKQSFDYTLDALGQIAQIYHEDGSAWDYDYDGRGRLSVAVRYDPTDTEEYREEYTYDDGDNMLTKAVTPAGQSTVTSTFTNNDANELVSLTDGTTTTSFAYDNWGRLTSKAQGVYSASYSYDIGTFVADITTSFPSETNVSYSYGGDNRRRERVTASDYTWYNWGTDWAILSEEDDLGSEKLRYTSWSNDQEGLILADYASVAGYRFYTSNHLGTTTGLYDGQVSASARYEFAPYGQVYNYSGSTETTRLFTGHDWDAAGQMYYAPFRYYSPDYATWASRDPAGMVDGPNMHAYAGNNPTNMRDVLGLACGPGFLGDILEFMDGVFKLACNKHDQCWSCVGAKRGRTQKDCDEAFRKMMFRACNRKYPKKRVLNKACKARAVTYYLAVSGPVGTQIFDRARSNCDECN